MNTRACRQRLKTVPAARTKEIPLRKLTALFTFFILPLLLSSCATANLKGISPAGKKVYLAPIPVQGTEAYQSYLNSPRADVSQQTYIFSRLKLAKDLSFYHDGSWYNWLEAYRGGMWLMRNRYKPGQDTRTFIRNYVERSETTGKLHLVRYPDGSTHIGSYILYNELDLLEETAARDQ